MQKDCTVLISSCDAYVDILPTFFLLLKKNWPNLSYRIVLSTEATEYRDDNLTVDNIHPSDPRCTWTERLYDALTKINTDTVFLLCDDFFLYDKVNEEKISKIVKWLKADKKIASFTLWPISQGSRSSKYDGFQERDKYAKFKVAIVAGLWNKKWLMKMLRHRKESAWEFEPKANIRSYKMIRPGKYYSLKESQNSIFPYDFTSVGLFSGKWLPETKAAFEKNGIEIDYRKRGFYDERTRALTKSVIESFVLDSRVLPNTYREGFNRMIRIKNSPERPKGYFSQTFRVKNGKNCFRWIIANQTGFRLSKLKILVKYRDGTTEEPDKKLLSGPFVKKKKGYYFNSEIPPYMLVFTRPNVSFCKITISGHIKMPLSEKRLVEVSGKETPPPSSMVAVVERNNMEFALSDENGRQCQKRKRHIIMLRICKKIRSCIWKN